MRRSQVVLRIAVLSTLACLLCAAPAQAHPSLSMHDAKRALVADNERAVRNELISDYSLGPCNRSRPWRISCLVTVYDPYIPNPDHEHADSFTGRVGVIRDRHGHIRVSGTWGVV